MFEAIRARNPAAARKAARKHLSNALNRYQQAAANKARLEETPDAVKAPESLLAQPR